jgi:hypothetical protein
MKHFVAALIACFVLSVVSPVLACWDGWSATLPKVELLQAGDSDWNPATARDVALWGTRIGALLPSDATLMSEHGFVTVSNAGGQVGEGKWDGISFESLFKLAAKILRARESDKERAREATALALTVQLFASRDRSHAEAFAAHLEAKAQSASAFEPAGAFYTAGGYPATHALSHVVTEVDDAGLPIHRVLAGAFLDRTAARKARLDLETALGAKGFVRPL